MNFAVDAWLKENGMKMKSILLVMMSVILICPVIFAANHPEPAFRPLPVTAHAHNDYEHAFPLWDALHYGFSSIEVDVHLADGSLFVAHDFEDIKPERTIQSLYLDPLRDLVKQNNGSVYSDGSRVLLLVDMKTESPDAWPALERTLLEYSDMLSVFREGRLIEGPVTAVISGNRDLQGMLDEKNCPALYDGRIEDLEAHPDLPIIKLISASWSDEFEWKGEGEIPEPVFVKMKSVVEQAHFQGRKIRFWGTDIPDIAGQEYVWDLLLEAGVDFINTDRLKAFSEFASRLGINE